MTKEIDESKKIQINKLKKLYWNAHENFEKWLDKYYRIQGDYNDRLFLIYELKDVAIVRELETKLSAKNYNASEKRTIEKSIIDRWQAALQPITEILRKDFEKTVAPIKPKIKKYHEKEQSIAKSIRVLKYATKKS